MPRLSIEGRTLDVSDGEALAWAIATMISPLEIVAGIHWALYFAMPGRATSEFLKTITRCVNQLQENEAVFNDICLLQASNKVLSSLVTIADAASELLEWQRNNVPKKERTAHNQAVKKYGPMEPSWAEDEEFQNRRKQLSLAFSRYLDVLSQIIPVLQMSMTTASDSLATQLSRASASIQQYQEICRVGYQEAVLRACAGNNA